MALIKCKECGAEISKTAAACPKCGAKQKKRTSIVTWIIGAIALVIVVKCSMDSADRSSAPAPKLSKAEEAAKAKGEAQFQRGLAKANVAVAALKASLRNPDSLVLDSVFLITETAAVCIEYRAQNGFGGTNREIAVFAPDGTAKNGSDDQVRRLWNKECAKKPGRELRHVIMK